MPTLLQVLDFAAEAHRKQFRKGVNEPYINHPIRVAFMAEAAGLSQDAVFAAVLHDVVEDTEKRLEDVEMLGVSAKTLMYVQALTKWWSDKEDPALVRTVHKPRYYNIIASNPETLNLKLLDRADNLRDMLKVFHTHSGWASAYLDKTQQEFPQLLARSENVIVKTCYTLAYDEVMKLVAKTRKV